MSAAKMEMGTEGFALLTRLFMSLKRAGRVIDVVWFQQSPEYARVVLGLVNETIDADGREAARRLTEMLETAGFVTAPRRPVVRAPEPQPDPVPLLDEPVEAATVDKAAAQRRYTTTLR